MRTFTFIIIIIVFFGCSERTTDQEIAAFEEELGQEEATALSKMVNHFEGELLAKYPNNSLDEAYEQHLNFIANDRGLELGEWVPAQLIKDSIFRSYSPTLLTEIWIQPDTVWIKDDRIFRSYRGDMNPSGHRIHQEAKDIDSLLYHERNTEIPNNRGTFMKALERISKSNKIANWYYWIKREAGSIHPAVIAEALNDKQLEYYDFNERISYDDYIVKRIILIETYTQTCQTFQIEKNN
ncbi:hypothetical protein [Ekhidna sp.]|uniref:hypothetical protein n=1 Tax=Ekhidna sp. TaxID=2608089 RepID=UPI003B51338F